MADRTCCGEGCATTLGPKNRSGLCRSCLAKRHNANPDVIARRLEGIRRHHANPEVIAASTARLAAYTANMPEEHRQRRRERGRQNIATLIAGSRNMSAELRAANGRKRSATVLAWCPEEWRVKYRELTSRGIRAPRAKILVQRMIAGRPEPVKYAQQKAKLAWCPPSRREEYRRVCRAFGAAEARRIIEADMTPFERQLAQAARVGIVEKQDFRTPGPAFTLGGIASAAL